jgi:hypothetical protein
MIMASATLEAGGTSGPFPKKPNNGVGRQGGCAITAAGNSAFSGASANHAARRIDLGMSQLILCGTLTPRKSIFNLGLIMPKLWVRPGNRLVKFAKRMVIPPQVLVSVTKRLGSLTQNFGLSKPKWRQILPYAGGEGYQ